MNGYASKETIKELRKEYKPGTVVVLVRMEDKQAPEARSMGEGI